VTIVNPWTNADAWDVVIVAGVAYGDELPGYAVVSGAGIPNKLDIRNGQGQTGATVAFTGGEVSEFKITCHLIDDPDADNFDEFRQVLVRGKALPIEHPALAYLGITQMMVKKEGQLEEDGDTGRMKAVIDCVQYLKPTPALIVPKAAFVTNLAAPQTAAEQQLNRLLAQQQELAK
jgi:hypothetical protein